VKNIYFVQKFVENVEIFVENNSFPSLMHGAMLGGSFIIHHSRQH
jgi:hypothetical protein